VDARPEAERQDASGVGVGPATDHRHSRIRGIAGAVDPVGGEGRAARTATDPAVPRAQDDVQRADRGSARIRAIKSASGVTVNDVVLAMCSGALRAYLVEENALPETPLVAMVPISLRAEDEQDAGGNMVGTILCNLATDTDDPAKRLEAINASMRDNKKVFSELPRNQALALSAFLMSGIALALVPGFVSSAPPPFNIVISNVPGAREPLYWRGARLDGNYPLSIALDGQALNITLTNNADNLDFGLVGCRRSVPHLQRLLLHLEDSLTDLEKAVGLVRD
jgi:diacylglycerol O-acyltransferase